jgi:hypothetical protein
LLGATAADSLDLVLDSPNTSFGCFTPGQSASFNVGTQQT